ncbi:GMC family oxidoreductase N-terminal domain-containing protein [Micromonospora chersina]|uniref:GMC family oxidoreductase N-terminal domain-containing protein n=1 Tax=Micromonospora chersina TaxID=47854 RepID=UPI0033AB3F7E
MLVAGIGMSGGAVLARLLQDNSDLRIEVLDRGAPPDPGDPTPFTERRLSRSPGLAVPPEEDWLEFHDGARTSRVRKWWSARSAGGGAWLWYGQLSRFRPSDSDLPARLAGVPNHQARAWPLSYQDLVPHYEAVEELLRPYGCDYGMDPATYRAVECASVVPRPHASHFEQVVIDRLRADGLSPYVGQTALGGRAWDIRPVSPTTLDAVDATPPLRARSTWLGLLWDRLPATGVTVTTQAQVVRALVERGRTRGVEVVVRNADGELQVQGIRCRAVVLACGPLETVRVLLTSDLSDRARRVGNSFTLTQERVAYLRTGIPRSTDPGDVVAGSFANVVLKDFYEPPPGPGAPAKCGKFALYDGYAAELPFRHVRNLGLTGGALRAFLTAERHAWSLSAG